MDNLKEIATKIPNPMSLDKKTLTRVSLQTQLAGRPIGLWSQPEKDMVLEYLAKKYDLIPQTTEVK